jgi:hypothetical protein
VTSTFSFLLAAAFFLGCHKPVKTPDRYPDTAAGFHEFAQDLFDAAKNDRRDEYESLAASLQLPAPKVYFTRVFGDEAGMRLAAEYDQSRIATFGTQSWNMMRKFAVDNGRPTVTTSRHDKPDDDLATGHEVIALRAAKQPLALYTLQLTGKDGSVIFELRSFVHDGHQFRLVGHLTQVQPDEMTTIDNDLPVGEVRKRMRDKSGGVAPASDDAGSP